MEKNQKETMDQKQNGTFELEKQDQNGTMEQDEKAVGNFVQEPKINYRGWKAMPFIIGELRELFLFCFSLVFVPIFLHVE